MNKELEKNNNDLTLYVLEDEYGEEYIISNATIEQINEAIYLSEYDEDPDDVRDELGFDGATEHYLKKQKLIAKYLPVEIIPY